jgi:hypothetical protein
MTNILVAMVAVVAATDDRRGMSLKERFSGRSSSLSPLLGEGGAVVVFISTHVKNLTCPVCPYTKPENYWKYIDYIRIFFYEKSVVLIKVILQLF